VIRKRRNGLQVQVYAGRDPLTGRKRWVSRQVPGQTKRSYREAKKIEAELLGVVTREVVDSAGRWQASEGGVGTVMGVPVDPGLQGSVTGGI
jgi:hypothetical protein